MMVDVIVNFDMMMLLILYICI